MSRLHLLLIVLIAVMRDVLCRPRIAFGHKSEGYPFLAYIDIELEDELKGLRCGGTLIKPNWILTTVLCTKLRIDDDDVLDPHVFTVYLNTTKAKRGYAAFVKRIVIHEDLNQPKKSDNDVALFELTEAVPADVASVVALATTTPADKYAGQEALVVGYSDSDIYDHPDDLMEGYIRMLDDADCGAYVKNGPTGKLCARGVVRDGDVIVGYGDSGAPLLIEEDAGLVQIGMPSYHSIRISGGDVIVHMAFTDVGYYYDWIQEHSVDE